MVDEFSSNARVRGGGEEKGGGGRGFSFSFNNMHFVTVFQFKNTFPLFFFFTFTPLTRGRQTTHQLNCTWYRGVVCGVVGRGVVWRVCCGEFYACGVCFGSGSGDI